MKIVDMRAGDVLDKFVLYKKVLYVNLKNSDYNITHTLLNSYHRDDTYLRICTPGIIIPEIQIGDKVEIATCFQRVNICSGEEMEDLIENDGIYKLEFINFYCSDFQELEYVFSKYA